MKLSEPSAVAATPYPLAPAHSYRKRSILSCPAGLNPGATAVRGPCARSATCSLQPRPLHEIDLVGDPKVDLPLRQCRRCSAARRHYVPKAEDVPEPLQGLSAEALSAFRLLDVDVGPETRSTHASPRSNGSASALSCSWTGANGAVDARAREGAPSKRPSVEGRLEVQKLPWVLQHALGAAKDAAPTCRAGALAGLARGEYAAAGVS